MGKYRCGPSILRLPGRSAIVPGDAFEHDYAPAHEAMLLAAGAITLLPGEVSAADRIAEDEAAARAAATAAADSAAHTPEPVDGSQKE